MGQEPELKNTNSLQKEFQNLLDKDFKDRKLKENEIIKATVTEITKNFVVVDCKAKMEGMIPIEEFKNDEELAKLKVGSQIEVYLERIESFKGEIIDQVVVLVYKAPKSFTGEDVVEINCHGGTAVINKIVKTLNTLGLRLAEPGEFTKRALLNDKIDLVKTESISDIINAETEKQRSLAIKNLSGGLSKFTNDINKRLGRVLANLEALIDFSDEDLPRGIINKIKEQNKNIIKSIKKELLNAELVKPIRDGISVTIIGKPNTGKSCQ